MTTIPIYEVIEWWYDMDTHSPSDAMKHNILATFSNENAANMYRDELDYLRLKNIADEVDMGCNRWLEKDEYIVVSRELVIADTIGEVS